MAVGQSIAPSSDKTMKVTGVISMDAGKKTADVTDYMIQQYAYQQALDAKKKAEEESKIQRKYKRAKHKMNRKVKKKPVKKCKCKK
jgi:hypothetical protein